MNRKGFLTLFTGIAIGIIIGYLLAIVLVSGKPAAQTTSSTGQIIEDIEKFLSEKQKEVEKNPENISARIGLANMLFDLGRDREAAGHYIEILKIQPDNLSVMSDLGTCYHRLGEASKALEQFRKVVTKDPNHYIAWYNIAVTSYYNLKDIDTAKNAIEKVMSINPFYNKAIKLKSEIDSAAKR